MMMGTSSVLLIAAAQPTAQKLESILSEADIRVDSVCLTGEAALEVASRERAVILAARTLPDMSGETFVSRLPDPEGVLMIVPADYQPAEPLPGTLLLHNPISRDALIQAVRDALYYRTRLAECRRESEQLSRQLADRRLMDRAKGHMMERFGLTERDAHRRIQKLSMESGHPIGTVSREILDGSYDALWAVTS